MSHELENATPEDAANFRMPDVAQSVTPALSPETQEAPPEVSENLVASETIEEQPNSEQLVQEEPQNPVVEAPAARQESENDLAETIEGINRSTAELSENVQTLEANALRFLDSTQDDLRIINGRVGELNQRDRISQQTVGLAEQSLPHMRHLVEGMRELYGDVKDRATRFNENAAQLTAQLGKEQGPQTKAQLKESLREEINTFRSDLDVLSQEMGNRYIQLSNAAERMGESFVQHRNRSGRFLEEYSRGRESIRDHEIAPIVFKVGQFAENMAQERLRARVGFQEFSENTIAKFGGLSRSLEG